MIAAASIAAALHGLDWTGKSGFGLRGLFDELNRITSIEQVCSTYYSTLSSKSNDFSTLLATRLPSFDRTFGLAHFIS